MTGILGRQARQATDSVFGVAKLVRPVSRLLHGPANSVAEAILGADRRQRPVWVALVQREIWELGEFETNAQRT